MRVMVMIEGSGADEDKIAPNQEMLEQMDAYIAPPAPKWITQQTT